MPNVNPGSYYSTSPPIVMDNLVVVGGTVLDNVSTAEASGVIRAFDISTGQLVWNWDSGNPNETTPLPEGQTYTPNSPNSWSIMSADPQLGLVYVPLGNQPPDQWGANRSENVERYSSAVVALDIRTGQARWHFQTVHHDLWDYDVPAQASLIDLPINGETIPALVHRPSRANSSCSIGARASRFCPSPRSARRAARSRPTIRRRRSRSRRRASIRRRCARRTCGARPCSISSCAASPSIPIAMTAASPRPRFRDRSSIRAISASSTGARWQSIRSAPSCSEHPRIWPSCPRSFRAPRTKRWW